MLDINNKLDVLINKELNLDNVEGIPGAINLKEKQYLEKVLDEKNSMIADLKKQLMKLKCRNKAINSSPESTLSPSSTTPVTPTDVRPRSTSKMQPRNLFGE